jgi:hypothetical protein
MKFLRKEEISIINLKDTQIKDLIFGESENLLKHYNNKPLTDKYTMYQHLMNYRNETMQDDMYELSIKL